MFRIVTHPAVPVVLTIFIIALTILLVYCILDVSWKVDPSTKICTMVLLHHLLLENFELP